MSEVDLQRELARLAERLARIERHLQLQPPLDQSPQPASTAATSQSIASTSVADDESLHAIHSAPPIESPPVIDASAASSEPSKSVTFDRLRDEWNQRRHPIPTSTTESITPPTTPAAPPTVPLAAEPSDEFVPQGVNEPTPVVRASESRRAPLEVLIGGKWMAWVGAIVVVLAAGFAVKVGIDMGWWGRVSPTIRCIIIALFGGSLLAGGEFALRRFGRAASVGLFSAGLGTLYLDAFATARFFHIVSSEVSFVLMGVVALAGFFITLRTRFLTIGVLSLLGGYLAPLLIGGRSSLDLELLTYLTALLGIALGLSAVMPRPFRTLRYLALGGQGVVGLGWLLANASSQWIMAIVFLSVWWTMLLGECVYAALRRQSAAGNVIATVLATAAYVTAGCWVLAFAATAPNADEWLGAFSAMIAALCMVAALQFGPGLDGLRGRLNTAMDKLAVALWCQAGVLLTAAVALQFDGFGQSIAWLALGLAGIEMGRRLPSRGVAVFGLVVGSMAFTRVALIDWWVTPGFSAELWQSGDVQVTQWAILALATIGITHVAAHRLRSEPPAAWKFAPIALACFATALWMAVAAFHCRDLAMTSAWLLGAAALFALERIGRRQRYFEIGLMVLALTAIKWLFFDGLLARLAPAWSQSDRLFILNGQMAVAASIAAAGWWAYRILTRRERETARDAEAAPSEAWQLVLIAGTIFGLVAMTFEVDRGVMQLGPGGSIGAWRVEHVRQLLFTLLWGLGAFAIGVFAVLVRRQTQSSRSLTPRLLLDFAFVLLGLCALKWVFIDVPMALFDKSPGPSSGGMPILNLQLLVGFTLSTAGVVLASMSNATARRRATSMAAWIPVAAGVMILWGLSFEVDRALHRYVDSTGPAFFSAWNSNLREALCVTALWALGGWVMILLGRARRLWTLAAGGWFLLALSVLAWLTLDTLAPRIGDGLTAATPILNLQFAVGALLLVLLAHATAIFQWAHTFTPLFARKSIEQCVPAGFALIAALALWLGSLEIDRLLAHEPMSRQTGLSVYWGVCGIVLVVLGFARRATACRYAGLALLTLTVLKVLFVDLAHVDNIARVISFLVSGLLLIATSILYTRLAPKLLAAQER